MKSLLRWFIPLFAIGAMAVVFDAAMVVAQDAPPATPPATQPTGTIKVTVTGDDGKPAAGITVTVSARGGRGRRGAGGGGAGGGGGAAPPPGGAPPAGGGGAGGGRRGRGGPPIATGTTDATGVVTLSNIPVAAAPYQVRAANADNSLVGRGTANVTADALAAEVAITLGAPPAGRGGGGGGGGGGAPPPTPPPAPAPPTN